MNCTTTQDRCKFSMQKYKNNAHKKCTTKNSTIWEDFSFKMTIGQGALEKLQTAPPIQSAAHFLCATDLCNSDDTFNKVLSEYSIGRSSLLDVIQMSEHIFLPIRPPSNPFDCSTAVETPPFIVSMTIAPLFLGNTIQPYSKS